MPKKKQYDEVAKIVSEISECKLLSTEYLGAHEKLVFQCSCGRRFEKTFNHFLHDRVHACPLCAREVSASKRRLSQEELEDKLLSYGVKYVSGDYQNNRTPIVVLARCGHLSSVSLNMVSHPKYSGLCKDCWYAAFHGANRLVRDAVSDSCKALGGELVSSEYINAKRPLTFRCPCGEEFVSTWDSVKARGRVLCRRCSSYQSKAVTAIEDWLRDHDVTYTKEKTFPGCGPNGQRQKYRFDFYLPAQNVCIEYDGEQHFRVADFGGIHDEDLLADRLLDTNHRDLEKTRYCEEQGIELLRIKYTEQSKISEILYSKLIPR